MVHGTNPVSQSGTRLSTTTGSGTQTGTPVVNPVIAQLNIPMVSPVPTQTTVPSVKHAPLKMVSVPINSDIITQGNSQVVLIPMGGMDSAKLERTLKVPEGQKLVIIQPQEILRTIEQKKLQKNPTMVGMSAEQTQNLTIAQQGILLKAANQGSLQQIPISQVGVMASHPVQDKKGLVKLAPKSVPGQQGAPISQNAQRVSISQSVSNSMQPRLTAQLPKATMQSVSGAGVPRQTLQTSTVNKAAIPRPVVPGPTTILLQAMANQVSNSSGQAVRMKTIEQGVEIKQTPKTTLQNAGGMTLTAQPKLTTSTANNTAHPIGQTRGPNTTVANGTTSQTSVTTSQTGLTTSQTGLTTTQTTSQTSVTTSQTDLTTSQTSVTTSQTSVTTSQTSVTTPQTSLTTSQTGLSDTKPNVYQTLKQKLREGNSEQTQSNTASVKQTEMSKEGANPMGNKQSNTQPTQNEKVQSNPHVTKTPAQKIIVTYVSPDKPGRTNVTTDKRTGAYIQVPAKIKEMKQSNTAQSARVLNASNASKPVTSGTSSQPASGQKTENGQGPKTVSRISSPISHNKTEKDVNQVEDTLSSPNSNDTPSTSGQPNRPSIAEHENTLNDVVTKRGRPRKDQSIYTSSVANSKQDVKKPLSGPTLKHELDRQWCFSGRPKSLKLNEHQIKAVKHKRVSITNPWTCALCGKLSFANSLGCLYGPYDVDDDIAKEESGRGEGHDRSEGDEPQPKKRRGSSEGCNEDELWFHGDCIVWSPGVYALGESLVGHTQVVNDAQSRVRFSALVTVSSFRPILSVHWRRNFKIQRCPGRENQS